jgi:hypothetical protein
MESHSKLIRIARSSACIALFLAQPALSQRTTFSDVQVRFSKSGTDRKLIESSGSLIFDDTSRQLIVKSSEKPLQLRYDDIAQVVFDNTRHVRGASTKKILGLGILTDILTEDTGPVGEVIGGGADVGLEVRRSRAVNDYWMHIEIKMPGGSTMPALLEISKGDADRVISKAQQVFGQNIHVRDFPEIGKAVDKKQLKDREAKHDVKVDKINHPEPQVRSGKALVVVACPSVDIPGSGRWQLKLHAGDSVIAVTRPGTYSFAYLDPGEYRLASQAANANGFTMTLEAGGEYYFFQNVYTAYRTALSRNAKEIVMYEVQGSYYSDWKRKAP